ncbi:hypothetical protein BJ170DRAFT_696879 [Xylariales sp. AK1849]|nr:hypothetical protein BJ170DRAFT_696879 [Xylariales sp. AK1849]
MKFPDVLKIKTKDKSKRKSKPGEVTPLETHNAEPSADSMASSSTRKLTPMISLHGHGQEFQLDYTANQPEDREPRTPLIRHPDAEAGWTDRDHPVPVTQGRKRVPRHSNTPEIAPRLGTSNVAVSPLASLYTHYSDDNQILNAQELEAPLISPPVSGLKSHGRREVSTTPETTLVRGELDGGGRGEPVHDSNTVPWAVNPDLVSPLASSEHQTQEAGDPVLSSTTNIQHESSTPPNAAPDVEARIQEFLAEYRVTKRPGFDWISTLLDWIQKEIEGPQTELRRQLEWRDEKYRGLQNELYTVRTDDTSIIQNLQQRNQALVHTNEQLLNDRHTLHREISGERNRLQKHSGIIQKLETERNHFRDSAQRHEDNHASVERTYNAFQTRSKETELKLHSQISNVRAKARETEKVLHLQICDVQVMARETEMELRNQMDITISKMIKEQEVRETAWETERDNMRAEHDQALILMQRQRELDKANAEKRFVNETRALRADLNSCKKQIASYNNTGNYVAISDQDFRTSLQKVSQKINSLISFVHRPQEMNVNQSLDPSNFLGRHSDQIGRNWPKFVRNVSWGVVMSGLFHHPLGFGVFGMNGDGHEILYQLKWLCVSHSSNLVASEAAFPNEKDVNVWRATLFQAILRESADPSVSAGRGRYGELFLENIERVSRDWVETLQHISSGGLDTRAPQQIRTIAQELGILALQMGSQRAHVFLESCHHGDRVKPNEMFMDEGGSEGPPIQVDIMTHPCIRRVGDGRDDVAIQKVVAKGGFVSLRARH